MPGYLTISSTEPYVLQYAIKSKQTRLLKNFEFKRGVGITIKSKETSS